jgi:hypothetical protein
MKPDIRVPAIAILLCSTAGAMAQAPLGSGFMYQGRLKQHGAPFTGVVDLSFDLFAAESGGTSLGSQAILDVAVTDGLFVVELNAVGEFGADAFRGDARWLEVAVDGSTLTPRQKLAAAPYALHSDSTRGLAVDDEGRVGIGTATPASELTVAGTVETTAGGVKFPDGTVQVSAAPEGPGLWSSDGEHVVSTNTGNVGIGTTEPAAKLDVSGAGRVQTMEITGGTGIEPTITWGEVSVPIVGPYPVLVDAVTGYGYVVGIRPDGSLVTWGSIPADLLPLPEGSFNDVAIPGGSATLVAIRTDGTLVTRGVPINWDPAPSGNFAEIACGYNHCVALRVDGTVDAWGGCSVSPAACTAPGGTFTDIAAGHDWNVAIRTDGTLAFWGHPWEPEGVENVPEGVFARVFAEGLAGIAMRDDGTLVGWGHNYEVPSGSFVDVSLRNHEVAAVRSDGTVALSEGSCGHTPPPSGRFRNVTLGSHFCVGIREEPLGPPALLLHSDAAYKPGGGSWTTMSDRRLKTRINPLDDALAKFLSLQGHTYHWREPATQGNHYGPQMGLIADEVAQVFPGWIGRSMDGFQTLTVSGFEALTVEAVRELRREKDEQIEQQCDEIAALRERLQRLEAALAAQAAAEEAVAP